ncbi:MAG: hypothetical protein IK001_01835 [Lachnospiraceae bacterium]|nr:hypothetical protein [Lachnospiraceae bacterium]
MLIKTRLYLVAIILIILSIASLIVSIRNKNAAYCRYLSLLCCVGIIYLFIDLAVLVGALGLGIGLEVLLLYAAGAAAGVVYAAAIAVNARKRKTLLQAGDGSLPAAMKILAAVLILLPVIFISVRIVRDRILIARSDALVVFDSRGNGGIGDGRSFAYAIRGDECKPFDLHIGYGLKKIVPEGAVKAKSDWDGADMGQYRINIKNSDISILRGDEEIFRYDSSTGPYFNIDISECYYR